MNRVLFDETIFAEKFRCYSQMIYRLGLLHLKNPYDAEEIVQNTFMKLASKHPDFSSAEHEKAWMIRVAINECKNMQRSVWARRIFKQEPIEFIDNNAANAELFSSVLELPDKYKNALHLFYYEGYTIDEIAQLLEISSSAVKMRLVRARNLLKLEMSMEDL